jgi:hypothetical protein
MASKALPNKSEKNGAITLPHRLNRLHSYPQPSRAVSEKDPLIEDLKKVSIKDRIAQYNSVAQKVDSPTVETARDAGRKSNKISSPFLSTPIRDEEAIVHEVVDEHSRLKHEKEMRRHKYADVSPKLSLQSKGDIFVGKMVGLDEHSSSGCSSGGLQPSFEPEHANVDKCIKAEEPLKSSSHCELSMDATASAVLSSAEGPSRLDDISLDSDYIRISTPVDATSAFYDNAVEDRCRLAGHL